MVSKLGLGFPFSPPLAATIAAGYCSLASAAPSLPPGCRSPPPSLLPCPRRQAAGPPSSRTRRSVGALNRVRVHRAQAVPPRHPPLRRRPAPSPFPIAGIAGASPPGCSHVATPAAPHHSDGAAPSIYGALLSPRPSSLPPAAAQILPLRSPSVARPHHLSSLAAWTPFPSTAQHDHRSFPGLPHLTGPMRRLPHYSDPLCTRRRASPAFQWRHGPRPLHPRLPCLSPHHCPRSSRRWREPAPHSR